MPTHATECRVCHRPFDTNVRRHCDRNAACSWCLPCVMKREAECKAAKEKP